EIDPGSAKLFAEAASLKQSGRTSGVLFQQPLELGTKLFVPAGFFIFAFQLFQGRHQRFGNVASAVRAETPSHNFLFSDCACFHAASALRTAVPNSFNFSPSLLPA